MGSSQSKHTAALPVEKDCEAASDGHHVSAADRPRTLKQEIDDLKPHQRQAWERWDGREYAIIPHTDAAGDQYSIGDAYQGITCAQEWELNNPGPYLQYIKHVSKRLPHLEYLGHWMEVSCAPPKWRYMRHYPNDRDQRSKRAKVCVIDYTIDKPKPAMRDFDNVETLKKGLDGVPQTEHQARTRLIVAEDLSRDLVELLGSYYDVDPLFFLSHIGDYLFNNTRDPWAELPSLDWNARKRSHFCIQYLRGRYFEKEEHFETAEAESGMFNVLRRLDSDRSRNRLNNGLLDLTGASVVLTRSKSSLWIKPRKPGEPVTAILLVDPTVKAGHALWGGYRPFDDTPSMKTWLEDPTKEPDAPERKNFFDDVKYWCSRLNAEDLQLVDRDPRSIALPVYKLILAEWLTTLKYMVAQLGKIEWEFEKPHWGEKPSEIDALLKKISPWRRNVGYYQTMISEAIARLYPPEVRAPIHALGASSVATDTDPTPAHFYLPSKDDTGISSLWVDFRNVKRQIDEIQVRLKSIETMATNGINIEESRRAVKQNKNLARLTFLATIFIPLNFTSSFLSVSPDFPKAHQTIWLFFAIGIPITLLSLMVVDLTHPQKKGFLHTRYRKYKKSLEKKNQTSDRRARGEQDKKPSLKPMLTIPWPSNQRQDTKF